MTPYQQGYQDGKRGDYNNPYNYRYDRKKHMEYDAGYLDGIQ